MMGVGGYLIFGGSGICKHHREGVFTYSRIMSSMGQDADNFKGCRDG